MTLEITITKKQMWSIFLTIAACIAGFAAWAHQMWIEQVKSQEIQKYQTTAIVQTLEKTNTTITEFSRTMANHETRISVLEAVK